MGIHWNWRLASRLSVITLAILVVILVTLLQRHEAGTPQANTAIGPDASGLQGSDLGGAPAADFRLTDQFGKQIALSQFKGKPVVLTFLFTHCPDVCPLTAEKLHATQQLLGSDAQNIGILAVSTDPKRDTVEAALNFSQAHSMQAAWHFLVGTQDLLSPVWSNYHIFADAGTGNHSLGVFVIDKQGRQRVFLSHEFTPEQLKENLKILLKEAK
jgi:protein SCO1/2